MQAVKFVHLLSHVPILEFIPVIFLEHFSSTPLDTLSCDHACKWLGVGLHDMLGPMIAQSNAVVKLHVGAIQVWQGFN